MRILIVDDSLTSRLLFKANLPPGLDINLDEADACEGALLKISENSPDLIFLDYNLPGKNGVEIARAIRAVGCQGKFVLLTANLQSSIVDEAKGVGFVAVLEKPITRENVEYILNEIG